MINDNFGDLDADRSGSYCDYFYVADILSVRENLVVAGHGSVQVKLARGLTGGDLGLIEGYGFLNLCQY